MLVMQITGAKREIERVVQILQNINKIKINSINLENCEHEDIDCTAEVRVEVISPGNKKSLLISEESEGYLKNKKTYLEVENIIRKLNKS